MSQSDTDQLAKIVRNVHGTITPLLYSRNGTYAEERAAAITATGTIVAALIAKEETIYHDH